MGGDLALEPLVDGEHLLLAHVGLGAESDDLQDCHIRLLHIDPDIWRRTSAAEIEATARMVVGPDEPFSGHSLADMEADHWVDLAGALRRQGVNISAEELSRLPHGVELTERLNARLLDT